jgi:hypothetical protein
MQVSPVVRCQCGKMHILGAGFRSYCPKCGRELHPSGHSIISRKGERDA